MKKHIIKIAPYAQKQIQEIATYISNELLIPETADAWVHLLIERISSLDIFPNRFPIVKKEPFKSLGLRKMNVKNYYIYYYINEEDKIVWITAVVYGKRDQETELKRIPINEA